ncbi:MAG: transposase [Leptospirales bacterium]
MARSCLPLADAKFHPDAFYARLRLVSIDGSNLEVADEPDNVKAYGYPGSRTGHAGYPQAQCAVLVECATPSSPPILGAYRESEWAICKPLLARLEADMLCLADRGFNGYTHSATAQATGAQLLWRCSNNRKLPVVKALSDGSYLSMIYPSGRPQLRGSRCG